jgi:hypothetical protein
LFVVGITTVGWYTAVLQWEYPLLKLVGSAHPAPHIAGLTIDQGDVIVYRFPEDRMSNTPDNKFA